MNGVWFLRRRSGRELWMDRKVRIIDLSAAPHGRNLKSKYISNVARRRSSGGVFVECGPAVAFAHVVRDGKTSERVIVVGSNFVISVSKTRVARVNYRLNIRSRARQQTRTETPVFYVEFRFFFFLLFYSNV